MHVLAPRSETWNRRGERQGHRLTGLIGKILLSRAPEGSIRKVSEQKFFEIAAEQALLEGHTEPAVKALAMSAIDARSTSLLRTSKRWQMHRSAPDMWNMVFGLLHEIGHLTPDPPEDFHPLTSDENILGQLEWLSR